MHFVKLGWNYQFDNQLFYLEKSALLATNFKRICRKELRQLHRLTEEGTVFPEKI
jgi:hypothetical protein